MLYRNENNFEIETIQMIDLVKDKKFGHKAYSCLNHIRSYIGQVQTGKENTETGTLRMLLKTWSDRMSVSKAYLLKICEKFSEIGIISFKIEGDYLEIQVKNIIFGDNK